MVDFIGPPGDGHLQPRLNAAKEVDHGGADLRCTFLLGPMSATRQHYRGPELGDQCRLLRDVLGENGGDKIALARHVQRGNGHRRSGEGSHQLPAAIDVAPPRERTVESAPRVFPDVNVESDSVTQAGKDGGSIKKPPLRGIIPGGSPPMPADGGLSPDNV